MASNSRKLVFKNFTDDESGALFVPAASAYIAYSHGTEYTLTPRKDMLDLFKHILQRPYTAKWHPTTDILTIRFTMDCTASINKALDGKGRENIELMPTTEVEKKLFNASQLIQFNFGKDICKVDRQIAFPCSAKTSCADESNVTDDAVPSER